MHQNRPMRRLFFTLTAKKRAHAMDAYTTLRVLGEGAFGRVYLVREKRPPRRVVCVKQIHGSSASQCHDETKFMQRVRHPNVVRFVDSFVHQSRRCIAMEFCAGGDLRGFLAQQPRPVVNEDRVWYWAVQLCLALAHLHSQQPRGIWHRDVKTSNVFLTDAGFLVLGDLGVAREASLDLASTVIGTPLYMAPEIWDGKPYDGACDLWALGCLFYEVCTGRTPFEGAASTPALIRRVCEGKYTPLASGKWSQRLCTTVARLLSVDPAKRPTTEAILKDAANRIYAARYLQDRIHAAVRSGRQETENKEQAILRSQLATMGVDVDERRRVPESLGCVDKAPVVEHRDGRQVLENERRLQQQREQERQEVLRRALDRIQELRLYQQEEHQQLQQSPRVADTDEASTQPLDPNRMAGTPLQWKAPERDKRPASSRRRVSPFTMPIEFSGIPRHGVPVTKQASAFAAKTQSPLCRDVRILRKHEFAKAAERYKSNLDRQFNRKTRPPSGSPVQQSEDGDADAMAQLETALRAQLGPQ